MRQYKKVISKFLICAMAASMMPVPAVSNNVSAAKVAVASLTQENGRVNLFTGPKESTAWSQVVTFDSVRNNGSFDNDIIKKGGYFEANVTGDPDDIQMIFQSWTGGAGWAVVIPSEIITNADGSKLVRFTYDDIAAVYGDRFDLIDRIYFNTTWKAITLNSIDYVMENAPVQTPTVPSETPAESTEPSQSTAPVESIEPSKSVEPVESIEPSQTVEPVKSEAPVVSVAPAKDSVNLFTGENVLTANTTSGKISSKKNGGTLDPSIINQDGYFSVHFKGSRNAATLVFSSWTGGAGWATVSATAIKRNGYNDFTAIFSYDTIAKAYGDDFSNLDVIYFVASSNPYTIYSVDYVTSGVEAAIADCAVKIPPTAAPSYVPGELQERTCKADENHVKVMGRTFTDANGSRCLNNLCSGVEFSFTGTKASIDVQAVSNENKDHLGRIAIYVNDKLVVDNLIDKLNKTYDFFESEEEQTVSVKIMRLSESAYIPFAIDSINTTSTAEIQPTAVKSRKIEFIGDSITCGYGVDDQSTTSHWSTSNSDGSKAFAYKTAQKLGAEYSMFAASGFGVISGYTGGDINTLQTIPQYYGSQGFSWYTLPNGKKATDIAWNFDVDEPDAIVINLGTNDSSYTKNDEAKKAAFVEKYVDFLKQIRSKNPTATIFCTLGTMGQDLYPQVEEAVASYSKETGDNNITSLEFDVQNMNDGVCVDWHPTEATHEKASDTLADYMSYVMGW
ncbi:MAG TPA: hypothetical protein DCW90_10750 [Lachnospiraceae bacterium]|nr:hypothetical protein [Lachnospiraceae bacterium]